MLTLPSIGAASAEKRKSLGMSQSALAEKAGVSRATLDALENGRSAELGFSRLTRILALLGLELKLQEARPHRPTLDELRAELQEEDRHAESLDRRL